MMRYAASKVLNPNTPLPLSPCISGSDIVLLQIEIRIRKNIDRILDYVKIYYNQFSFIPVEPGKEQP